MAVVKLRNKVKTNLPDTIRYVINPEKNDGGRLVYASYSSERHDANTLAEPMIRDLERCANGLRKDGVLALHLKHSFSPDEHVSAEQVHELGGMLLLVVRKPASISEYPRKYLLVGGVMFVLYEAFISLAIGLASTSVQSLEVSLVNYLWPTLLVLMMWRSCIKRVRYGVHCLAPLLRRLVSAWRLAAKTLTSMLLCKTLSRILCRILWRSLVHSSGRFMRR